MRNFGDKLDNTAPLPSGILSAEEDNVRFRELENAVSTAGISLDGGDGPDSDVSMLAQAQARYASGGIGGQDVGSANAYVLQSLGSFVMPKAYFTGMTIRFYPAHSNTGACTVNAFGLGAVAIKFGSDDPLAGDLTAGVEVMMSYYGGVFLLSPFSVLMRSAPGGTPVYQGRIGGRHVIRPLEAGTNISFALTETSAGSGEYRIRINAAAGGGGGGGSPHENVGGGAQIHRTNDGTYDELRTLIPDGGISILQEDQEIRIQLEPVAPYSFLVRNGSTQDVPAPQTVYGLVEETAPAAADELLLSKAGNAGLRKIRVDKLTRGIIVASGIVDRSDPPYDWIFTNMKGCAGAMSGGNANITFTAALADTEYVVTRYAYVGRAFSDGTYAYDLGAGWVGVDAGWSNETINGFSLGPPDLIWGAELNPGVSTQKIRFVVTQLG